MKRFIVSALAAVFLAATFAMADTCSEPMDPHCYDHDSCLADDPSKCSSCAEGYYLVGGVAGECVQCPANCASCYDSGGVHCSYCEAGYGLRDDGATCYACGEHCEYCSATACYQCNSGYVDSGDGKYCAACTTGCNYICAPGYYYYDDTGDCGQCSDQIPARCDHCWEGNNSLCEYCADGYYQSVSRARYVSGVACVSGFPCVAWNADDGKCLECLAGWYADADGVCHVCDKPGCSCSSAGNDCLNCDNVVAMSYSLSHYATGLDGKARCCYEGCSDCSVTWNDTSINVWTINNVSCSVCEAEWYYETDSQGTGICANCGYYVDACSECTVLDAEGFRTVTCTACLPGYRYNADTEHCDACMVNYDGCGKCEADISVCEGCQSHYHEVRNESSGALLECLECDHWACSQCHEAPTVCDECEAGYQLREYQDEEGYNYTDCNACAEGYGGDHFCLRCPERCTKCDKDLLCTECSDGNYLTVLGQCTPLVLPGGTCDPIKYPDHADCGSGQCLNACCATADKNCLLCSASDGSCWECAAGYYPSVSRAGYVVGEACVSGYPCVTWNWHDGFCTECLAGWYADSHGSCQVCEKPGCSCSSAGNDCLNCDNLVAWAYSLGHYVTGQDGKARCCYEGCSDCSVTWNDTSVDVWTINNVSCSECEADWYHETDSRGTGICANCGYYVDGCAECTVLDAEGFRTVTCTACLPGRRFNRDDAVCEGCQSHYHEVRNELTGALLECLECDHRACLHCRAAPSVCDECETGYQLRKYQDEEGANHTDCGACAEGYGGNPEDSCLPCPRFCAQCDEALECHECSEGYYLTALGHCTPLLLPGGTCDPVKYPNHTDCGSAQCLNAVCCAWYDKNCVACSTGNGWCKECAAGYIRRSNGTCGAK
jgi:ribosomal protein L33